MQFSRLAQYFSRIETTPKRLEITAILAELLKEASQYLQKYYKELGYWDKVQKQHEALFAQALWQSLGNR